MQICTKKTQLQLLRKIYALKAQNNIAQGKRSGALGNVGNNVGALQGQFIIIFYELRLQRAINGGFTKPNVPFAALTLRWAINELRFQRVRLKQNLLSLQRCFRFGIQCY